MHDVDDRYSGWEEDGDQEGPDDLDPAEEDESQDEDQEDDGPYREDEYGEYAELLNAIREWRARISKYGGDPSEGEQISMAMIEKEVAEVLQDREKLVEELKELPENAASTWQKKQRQMDRESSLRRRLSLLSVGLTSAMIGDVADDANHLIDDTFDEGTRSLRKTLRAQMQQLSRQDRAMLLGRMLRDGRITQDQYSYLRTEFGG